MRYVFEIPVKWPSNPDERRSFRWLLEAHVTRFREYHSLGIGWKWYMHNHDPVRHSVWIMGSFVGRTIHQLLPHMKLYSTGERVIVRPGDQVASFVLEVS